MQGATDEIGKPISVYCCKFSTIDSLSFFFIFRLHYDFLLAQKSKYNESTASKNADCCQCFPPFIHSCLLPQKLNICNCVPFFFCLISHRYLWKRSEFWMYFFRAPHNLILLWHLHENRTLPENEKYMRTTKYTHFDEDQQKNEKESFTRAKDKFG